jgi:hypothetical protein
VGPLTRSQPSSCLVLAGTLRLPIKQVLQLTRMNYA